MASLSVGAVELRTVDETFVERPRLYLGARERMFDNSPISTERDGKRIMECDVDLYTPAEESALRAACPRGVPVVVAGDLPATSFDGLVDIGDAQAYAGTAEDGEPIWKTVRLHIEEA